MDADALGRHGGRLVPFPGVFAKQKPQKLETADILPA
jgi:hypothetical protein